MARGTDGIVKGLLVAAVAVMAVPGLARADRDDRGRGGDDRDRNRVAPRTHYYDRAPERDERRPDGHDGRGAVHDRGPSGGGISVSIGGGTVCPPAPVFVDRATQVWVEPVYRTVCEKVWVEPVYRTECERLWREPVVERRVERVWVAERRELRSVWRGRCLVQEWVIVPGHYQDVCRDVVVVPGRWEEVSRQVLVAPGRWENVERQELVAAGHWETRVERVAVATPPVVREGWRVDVRLPVRW